MPQIDGEMVLEHCRLIDPTVNRFLIFALRGGKNKSFILDMREPTALGQIQRLNNAGYNIFVTINR